MRKVLISGYIGFNNFGDEAIFYALVHHLKGINVSVSALCNNPEVVKQKYNIDTFYFKNPFEILSAVLKCDILYSGGGSLLQNKTSNFSLYYYLFIIIIAKLLFKKVFIFSQGIEPVIGKFNEFLLKMVLNSVDYITLRDENSVEYLKSLGISADLTSDPVYALVNDCKISDSKEGLIVQLRNYSALTDDFLDELADAIKPYKGNIKVLSLQNDMDETICKRFVEKLRIVGVKAKYVPFYSIERTFEIINNSEFVISTRLHGLILANALKSKTFALIYDDKVKTLTDELKIPNIDLRKYKTSEIVFKIRNFFKNEPIEVPYRKFDWSLTDLRLLRKDIGK